MSIDASLTESYPTITSFLRETTSGGTGKPFPFTGGLDRLSINRFTYPPNQPEFEVYTATALYSREPTKSLIKRVIGGQGTLEHYYKNHPLLKQYPEKNESLSKLAHEIKFLNDQFNELSPETKTKLEQEYSDFVESLGNNKGNFEPESKAPFDHFLPSLEQYWLAKKFKSLPTNP